MFDSECFFLGGVRDGWGRDRSEVGNPNKAKSHFSNLVRYSISYLNFNRNEKQDIPRQVLVVIC